MFEDALESEDSYIVLTRLGWRLLSDTDDAIDHELTFEEEEYAGLLL